MLFNSYEFLVFLGISVWAYYALARWDMRAAKALLVGASFFFYGWWKASYVALLVASIAGNYVLGLLIRRARLEGRPVGRLLAAGVAGNLGLLGYFKYAGFLVVGVNDFIAVDFPIPQIVLPLAISFFTFQQIAFLADAARGEARNYDFLDYVLFVTFFPQLIAGPIVHHREMLPQFASANRRKLTQNLSIGTTIFVIGLFKKVAIADELAPFADAAFDAAATGAALGFVEAWAGTLAYTLQIYFDFSGYSDMAVGLARMFGIRLPINFYSPYKATSIIDFWRRWHITLSRFLRDYLYIPLGGSRRGVPRRFLNLMVTMLLGGLWHGAGWTFVIWGGLHGAFLVINHLWRHSTRSIGGGGGGGDGPARTRRVAAGLFTFFCVAVAWIFFRAADLATAVRILEGAVGLNGVSALGGGTIPAGLLDEDAFIMIALGSAVCWAMPNTVDLMARYRPVLDPTAVVAKVPGVGSRLVWRPSPVWAFCIAALGFWAVLHLARVSPFLYFQF